MDDTCVHYMYTDAILVYNIVCISCFYFLIESYSLLCIYEVSSIKNTNLSIKYELIKLQKFQIAPKKGINVVVRFQYSEIS